MSGLTRRVIAVALAAGAFVSGAAAWRQRSVLDLLNRYEAGEFEVIARELDRTDFNFADLLKRLQADGPQWIAAAPPSLQHRRRLAAASFALEAARADAWHEWKWLVRQPLMTTVAVPGDRATGAGGGYQPLNVLYWKPAPLLIEWGCEMLRRAGPPSPAERWWHLAALAVAQRSEDTAFLLGDPARGRGYLFGEIDNTQDEIKHLQHSRERFPAEGRFVLAEAIARDRRWSTDAARAYEALADDDAVGGEALMRLGVMQYRAGRIDEALKSFDRAEEVSRDPYVLYVAAFIRGRIAETQRKVAQARDAYTRSVTAYPHGQSATLALAGVLFQQGNRAESQALTGAMFAANPLPPDPWRQYVHADDRFWPVLVAKLHRLQTEDRR